MIIYLATSPSGKQYVGQTCGTLQARMREHHSLSRTRKSGIFRHAIKKYGIENLTWTVLFYCNSFCEMNWRETMVIDVLNTVAPNGYNLEMGGKNSPTHETTKEKIRIANTGNKKGCRYGPDHHAFGKTKSPEERKRVSDSRKGKCVGKDNPNYQGKSWTDESRRKFRESTLGRKDPPETIERKRIAGKKRFDLLREQGLPLMSEENKEILLGLHLGRIASDETRGKQSVAQKKRFQELRDQGLPNPSLVGLIYHKPGADHRFWNPELHAPVYVRLRNGQGMFFEHHRTQSKGTRKFENNDPVYWCGECKKIVGKCHDRKTRHDLILIGQCIDTSENEEVIEKCQESQK